MLCFPYLICLSYPEPGGNVATAVMLSVSLIDDVFCKNESINELLLL